MLELREYQQRGITETSQRLASGKKSIVFQLPTGGGKTVIFTEIIHRFLNKNQKSVMVVVHREELLKQTASKLFKEYDIAPFIINAGVKHVTPSRVYVCMVESLNKRLAKIANIGLLIIDECHIAVHNKIIDNIQHDFKIGFSATPVSSNKKEPLKKRYDDIVIGSQISELISNKFLCQNITYAPKTGVNRNSLKMKGGDFDDVEMGKEFSKPKFIINTVDAHRKWCNNGKTIVFNVNIEHSIAVMNEFIANGFNARHIDSKSTSDIDRVNILEWFKSTPDAVLCNVGILTTGFDEPTIENVIVNKATTSLSLWLQMCGRGSRTIDERLSKKLDTHQKFSFTIIDMGSNAITHGDWCDDHDWKDMFFNTEKKAKNTVAPSKNCPCCEAILHAAQMTCKFCGFVFPPKEVAIEELLSQYVVMTKNIDVQKIIEDTLEKKQYFAFFRIVREHAVAFKRSQKEVNNDTFDFVVNNCFNDCKSWCHINGKKFNKWHKDLCVEELGNHLNFKRIIA